MQQQIRTKEIEILNAENGDFDLLLRGQRQNPQQIITKRIRILNAYNGDFELMVEEDHTIEDTLIQNTPMDEYVNDRVTVVGAYKFFRSSFKKINLPNVTRLYGSNNFNGDDLSTTEEIYLPKLTTIGNFTAEHNLVLKVLDLGSTTGVHYKFRNCPLLTTLILRKSDAVVAPTATASLANTPLAPNGTGGYVYVPQALLSQYQASQAWADYANVIEFRAIEGSIYE